MDFNNLGVTGIEAPRRVLEASPDIAVLMLTMFEDDKSIFAAMRAAANGEAIFSPTITQRFTEYFAAPEGVSGTAAARAFPNLTEREHEILSLMAAGYTNTAIASRLYLSPKTVRNYVSSIFAKLQAADRPQAIIRAREAELGGETG